MFGSILSTVIDVATLPLDAASIAADVATGGSGSKRSRSENPILGDLEKIRDAVSDAAERIDE